MLAELKAVTKSTCRVQILEGLAEMTMKSFAFQTLMPFVQVDALEPLSTEGGRPKLKRRKCASALLFRVQSN